VKESDKIIALECLRNEIDAFEFAMQNYDLKVKLEDTIA